MMRQQGSAMGSLGVAWVGVDLGCFGLMDWFGLGGVTATFAHDLGSFAVIGVACVHGSHGCGCREGVVFVSSSFSFLVKYALVSARYVMVGSVGFVGFTLSVNSIMLLSQFLKKPILFQDEVFLLFLSSFAIIHISLSRLLMVASSISSSCLCWSLRYLLYASSISSWVICCSISSKSSSLTSGVDVSSSTCGLPLCVSSSGSHR